MKIQLTVAYVGFGGNIGGGEYFYSYSPNVIICKNKEEELIFEFSPETLSRFTMQQLITSDSNQQFGKVNFETNQRSLAVKNYNINNQLILLSILVNDVDRNKLISCDPQVLNIPDPD